MQSIRVTGGAGYVGAHSCKALRNAGYLPVVVDNLSTGHESFVRWGPLVRADIRDREALAHTFASHNIAAVLHFAASAYVGECGHRSAKILREQRNGGAVSIEGGPASWVQ